MIEKQDMEQLAVMVLNGDGQYLIGTNAAQPEIQAFIDNVPAYMVNKTSQLFQLKKNYFLLMCVVFT